MRGKAVFCFYLFACINASVFGQIAGLTQANSVIQKADNHQYFIENKGQWPAEVLYLSRIGGLDAWITRQGVNYTFYKVDYPERSSAKTTVKIPDRFDNDQQDVTVLGHRVLFELQNVNSNPAKEGKRPQTGYYNYLIGNDPSKHASNVRRYEEVWVKNIYAGVDVRYYFEKGNLRYDFVVAPNADPAQIQFKFQGEYDSYLKLNGSLAFTTRFGEVAMGDLTTYQDHGVVSSKFRKQGDSWTVSVGDYDRNKHLIIDPLVYSTYIGGTANDWGFSLTLDSDNNVYVAGQSNSTNYDVTAGVFQTTLGGGYDVFVTKLNSTGTALIYSTYIGGSSDDRGYSIALDDNDNAYVTGFTNSNNYDITAGAFQTTLGGGNDVFVTKLNSTGTALIYSTYVGGSGDDRGYSIALDGSYNAYVTGYTTSNNYDITAGVFQTTNGGGSWDVFVTKLNSSGAALIYSTYIGGSGDDWGSSLAIDNSGNAYVTGYTQSSNYDVTPGAFQTTSGGVWDIFVTKLNSNGTALIYSTYIGGSGQEDSHSLALDNNGNVYITGYTYSTDYDVTSGAFQTTSSGDRDVIVTKLNSSGTALIYSTYIGGLNTDEAYSIGIDAAGNAYITGVTRSSDYDVTAGAFQTIIEGVYDVFVTKLNSNGTALVYSTYIGGASNDYGCDIAIDNSENVYITAYAQSTNYDITAGAFQTTHGGGVYDVAVTKLIIPVPYTVKNLSMTVSNITHNGALLNWGYDGNTPCDSIKVYIKKSIANSWYKIETLSGAPTSFQRQQLQAGIQYLWQCETYYNGVGTMSNSALFTTPAKCAIFTGTNETNVADSAATLNWFTSGTPDSVKVVYRRVGGNWFSVTTSNISVTLTNLWQATDYEWKAQAYCNGVVSATSDLDSFTTLATCGVPTNLASAYYSPTQRNLFWDIIMGASSYNIQWRLQGNPNWTSIVNNIGPTRNLGSLSENSTYEWRVRTNCNGSYGPWSSIDTFTHVLPKQLNASGISAVVYPVPTKSGYISVRFSGESGQTYSIMIQDVMGRIIATQQGSSETENDILVNLNNCSLGVYNLILQMGDKFGSYKVVVE